MTLPAPGRIYTSNPGGMRGTSTRKSYAPVTVCTNTAGTIGDATDMLNPLNFSSTICNWIKIDEDIDRVFLRVRRAVGTTVVTTSPVVKVYGVFADTPPDSSTNQFANDGTIPYARIDAATTAAGTTLTCVVATDQRDSAYQYSDWVGYTHPVSGIKGDTAGASYILVMLTTASNFTNGGTPIIQALGLMRA
jgi:hypothetical protein